MKCKCIENKHRNTNFTVDKEYKCDLKVGIDCDWGGMWCKFKEWNRPTVNKVGDVFEFAMCKFIVI